MLHSVSWYQFTVTMIVLLFIYYLGVIVLYYRRDLVRSSRQGVPEDKRALPVVNPGGAAGTDANSILFSTVHELMEDLKNLFYTASKNDYPKEELMMALQVKLREYVKLQGTPFQVSVNNHIEKESKDKCAVILTQQDIRNLW